MTKKICKSCAKEFAFDETYFDQKGYKHPNVCMDCRQIRKHLKTMTAYTVTCGCCGDKFIKDGFEMLEFITKFGLDPNELKCQNCRRSDNAGNIT